MLVHVGDHVAVIMMGSEVSRVMVAGRLGRRRRTWEMPLMLYGDVRVLGGRC